MTMNPNNNRRSASGSGGSSSVQDHYSLRWNNHQNHILRAFDALLQTKTLVDVTLVCAETSIRAHKIVLSACSPFFQRVFAETPCKHPVIVLKDFRGWVVQAIVDFMYRGEISVPQERLQTLIQAGESLQVRGLVENSVPDNTPTPAASPDDFENLIDTADFLERCSSPDDEESPSMVTSNAKILLPSTLFSTTSDDQDNLCTSPPMPLRRKQARPRRRSSDESITPSKPTTPITPIVCKVKSEFMSTENRNDENKSDLNRPESSLEDEHNEPSNNPTDSLSVSAEIAADADYEDTEADDNDTDGPENLCTKRAKIDDDTVDYKNNNTLSHSKNLNTNKNSSRIILSLKDIRQLHKAPHQMVKSPPFSSGSLTSSKRGDDNKGDLIHSIDSENPFSFDQMDLSMAAAAAAAQHHHNQLNASSLLGHMTNQVLHGPGGHERLEDAVNRMSKDFTPASPMNLPPMNFSANDGGPPHHPPSPLPFPGMSGQMSALGLTPPHMFGLDSPLGLFPPGMDPAKMFNPLMDMSDPRGIPGDHPTFLKKKIPRPKGQHSAPRGGPPRSWTNAELTEALQHVWNKKMTTSQASRIFGIPYNSLLMYVRGKYGKSLKLEQLRKDCISGPSVELLTIGMSGNGNGNHSKINKESSESGSTPSNHSTHQRSSSSEPSSNEILQGSNPTNTLFNPFPPNFYPDFPGGFPGIPLGMLNLLPPDRQQSQGSVGQIDEDCKSDRSKHSIDDDFSAQPLALNRSSVDESQQTQNRNANILNGANQD